MAVHVWDSTGRPSAAFMLEEVAHLGSSMCLSSIAVAYLRQVSSKAINATESRMPT